MSTDLGECQNSSFYRDYFLNTHHAINVNTGHGLEKCFRDIWLSEHMQHAMLPLYPIIQGVGGGIATYYSNTKKGLERKSNIADRSKNKKFALFFLNKTHPMRLFTGGFKCRALTDDFVDPSPKI